MSYPGRPALVPGLPMGMPYMPLPGAPPMVPAMMPVPHMMNTNMVGSGNFPPSRRNKNVMQQPPSLHKANQMLDIPKGPPVTLFVGNITERAPDPMIRHILQACGHVNSWKKVSGFGFCEYANPDAGLRAIRLLHEKEIGEKKLVVTVDAKAKTILDEYKQTRKAALKKKLEEKRLKEKNGGAVDSPGDKSPTLDENDDYDDDFTREEDKHASDRIGQILRDYRKDMERHKANEPVEERPKTGAEITQQRNQHTKIRLQQLTQAPSDLNQDPEIIAKLNLDTDIEKKDIITREIGKFREIMKKQEEERDVERRRREEREREEKEREKRAESPVSNGRNRSPLSPVSPGSLSSHHRSHRTRSRSRDREYRDRSERSERSDRSARDSKTKEREERLRLWEQRERHKAKELQKEKEKKKSKEEEKQKEAKRLKEFLEDYDDERDDVKYYKGREMQRRLDERIKEMESDAKDRQKEKEELEELRAKIFSSQNKNPDEEFRKVLKARENLYKPRILVEVNTSEIQAKLQAREAELEEQRLREEKAREEALRLEKAEAELAANADSSAVDGAGVSGPPINQHDSDDDRGHSPGGPSTPMSPDNDSQDVRSSPPPSSTADKKKKKLDVKEVFNNDEDEEDSRNSAKKRKLVPLDYGDEKKKKEEKPKDKEDTLKSLEEKKKYIKSFIEKIPTDKKVLFNYQIDWAAVDNQLMERKIRPWINKKIIEYIGEPEPTLVDFICSKVLAGSAPQGVLDDVQMVLDEEAEIFVVKMWRLLIYETEAKKLGLGK
ncbi:hypothetical protein M8J75_016101 [Diaphorina citri]|nr:hypothetical protein M8J75_016101 [Diaphorina citri]